MPSPSVPANALVDAIRACGISHVVTVPDYVQISLHKALEREAAQGTIHVVACATEDEALAASVGLWIGGEEPLVIMQNQGLYASCNALRALGTEARFPLLMLVGQFAREFSNLESDPQSSRRPLVPNTERILDAMDVPFLQLESAEDIDVIQTAFSASRQKPTPFAVLIGAQTAW